MPIAAAIERDNAKPTTRALVAVSAENRRAAAHDRAHHLQLLETDSVMVHEGAALRAEDVGHLHGRPIHSSFFFRRLGFVPSPEMGRASMGHHRCQVQRVHRFSKMRSLSAAKLSMAMQFNARSSGTVSQPQVPIIMCWLEVPRSLRR